MSKSIEITCPTCHGLLRLVEVPKEDTGECPTCNATIDLKKCLPDYVQNSLQADGSFFDDLPKRMEASQDSIALSSAPTNTEVEPEKPSVEESFDQKVEDLISFSTEDAEVLLDDTVSVAQDADEPIPTEEVTGLSGKMTEERQRNTFSSKLQEMEDQLKSLIYKTSSPAVYTSNEASVTSISPVSELGERDVPQLEEKLVEKNSQLKSKLETLDAVYQQLRAEHAHLTKRFRTLEEEREQNLLTHSAAGAALSLKSGDTEKIVNYEKEKNKILKQKWQESLLQLKKSEEKMKLLATQLLQKDGLLKERESYVSSTRQHAESQLLEIEKQGERIRQEAETRKAFEKKILELTQEVERLKGEVDTNEKSRAHLESLLKSRDAEVAQHKQSFHDTQNKIDLITQEIVDRERTLSSQLTDIEKSRAALEEDAKNLELEKSNLKKLVTELNQRLADVRESEEKVAKELKDQEIYKNAFANERAELDQLRSDILRQKDEIESSKIQLLEKNVKLTEIQNLIISEKQAFEADRIAFDATINAKDLKELELKKAENELTEQKVKLNQAEKVLKDKEVQLRDLEELLTKKEGNISKVQDEITHKKGELKKQEEHIKSSSLKLRQEEETYEKSFSLFNNDKNSINAEQDKLEAVRQRIKEDFLTLEQQKKEFEEYRKRTENSFSGKQEQIALQKPTKPVSDTAAVKSLSTADDVIRPTPTAEPVTPAPKKSPEPVEEAAIQKKTVSNRFTPAPSTIEKKRPQYRRFDEAQATKEEFNVVNAPKNATQPDTLPLADATPKVVPTETKPTSKIPDKVDRKPLPTKPKEAAVEPIQKVVNSEEGKVLDEFAPSKIEKGNKPRNTKKAKNKVFWSAGLILIPLTLCLGAVAYILSNDQEIKASLPPIKDTPDEVISVNTEKPSQEALMLDNDLLPQMEEFTKKTLGEGLIIDEDKSKELNESLMNNEITLPVDDIPELEGKLVDSTNYENSEISDDILSGIMDENELKSAIPSVESLLTEEDAPKVVKVKPARNPLFDPQDVNKSDHIGMIPPDYLD